MAPSPPLPPERGPCRRCRLRTRIGCRSRSARTQPETHPATTTASRPHLPQASHLRRLGPRDDEIGCRSALGRGEGQPRPVGGESEPAPDIERQREPTLTRSVARHDAKTDVSPRRRKPSRRKRNGAPVRRPNGKPVAAGGGRWEPGVGGRAAERGRERQDDDHTPHQPTVAREHQQTVMATDAILRASIDRGRARCRR
jgi:hypothetical protein